MQSWKANVVLLPQQECYTTSENLMNLRSEHTVGSLQHSLPASTKPNSFVLTNLPVPGRGAGGGFLLIRSVFAEALATFPHIFDSCFILWITRCFQDKGMFLQRKLVKESSRTPFLNVSPFSCRSRGKLLSIKYIIHHVRISGGFPSL